jgi:hypothetical protein
VRDQPDDTRCPCGHDAFDGEWRCVNGRVYGPCEDPFGSGVCVMYDKCSSPNGCCDDE